MMTNPIGNRSEHDSPRLRAVRYFSGICSGLDTPAERQARISQVRELEAKSDEELLDLGLLREDIVDHVFRDAHYV